MKTSRVSLGPGLRGGGLSTAPGSAEGAARDQHMLRRRVCRQVLWAGAVPGLRADEGPAAAPPAPVPPVPRGECPALTPVPVRTPLLGPSHLGGAGRPLLQGLGGSWGQQRPCDSPPALETRVLPSPGKHVTPPSVPHCPPGRGPWKAPHTWGDAFSWKAPLKGSSNNEEVTLS